MNKNEKEILKEVSRLLAEISYIIAPLIYEQKDYKEKDYKECIIIPFPKAGEKNDDK